MIAENNNDYRDEFSSRRADAKQSINNQPQQSPQQVCLVFAMLRGLGSSGVTMCMNPKTGLFVFIFARRANRSWVIVNFIHTCRERSYM